MGEDRKDKTHQKSHPEKSVSDEHSDPSTDSPCAHHHSRGRRTQQTERSAWYARDQLEERSKRSQMTEAQSNQESNPKDAQEECPLLEQRMAGC